MRSWPTVYVIDHEGVIRQNGHSGLKFEATLAKLVAVAAAAAR